LAIRANQLAFNEFVRGWVPNKRGGKGRLIKKLLSTWPVEKSSVSRKKKVGQGGITGEKPLPTT